jgi:Tfp pilus assembly protein PilZ
VDRQNVLIVGVEASTFEKIAPVLSRDAFDVDRFPGASGALELLSTVTFRALIVGYPLADLPVDAFLARVRASGSPSRHTPLILLAPGEKAAEAATWIGRGANRVVALESTDEVLQREISELLAVAPRAALREMLRLELRLADQGSHSTLVLCQTENVSATGMLVRTDRRFDIGSELGFELTLSGDPRSVKGRARVVRHTFPGRDSVNGMGLRFVSFEGDGQTRFQNALAKRQG